ncbi:hypothetical protein AB0D29_13695 [Streptomyces sp. NPDC048424]|uniref:hypothetical protein n=1 Tax=Streptomyces sp. NPDC048424 TaxID=3155265 RepID=UPI00341AC801
MALSDVVLLVPDPAGARNPQAAQEREGRYFAFDTAPHARGTVEVSRSRYQAVLESDQRSMFAIPGVLFTGAAYVVLVAGELRPADRVSLPS